MDLWKLADADGDGFLSKAEFNAMPRIQNLPEEKRENATALLTIAAAQTGATDDAAVYFQDLLKIDPAWAKAQTLETLDWPEELKASLRQFMP